MASEVIMPRVDMDMAEGKIAYWYVKNGDRVSKGQPLFDIETDKATMEVEAHADGIVQGILGEVGVMMPVGTIVAWLLAEGEALPGASTAATAEAGAAVAEAESTAPSAAEACPAAAPHADTDGAPPTDGSPPSFAPAEGAALRATPLARSLARSQQVDLSQVSGSGPRGRILARDLPVAATAPAAGDNTPLHRHWLFRGAGAPLVLLHGFGADHGSWKPFAAHLQGLPALAIDLPNHGKSGPRPVESLQSLALSVLEVLAEEKIEHFHLLGHSLGGGVALALTHLAPERVKSLTLIAPAGLGPDINGAFIDGLCRAETEAALRPWLTELVSDPRLISGSFITTAHKQLAPAHKREALRSMAHRLMPQGTQAESLRHVLGELYIPTKVIWGTEDRIIPAHHGQGLPGRVGLHVLRGVGHLPHVESPELVADLVAQQMRH